jgi:hypothetical protein
MHTDVQGEIVIHDDDNVLGGPIVANYVKNKTFISGKPFSLIMIRLSVKVGCTGKRKWTHHQQLTSHDFIQFVRFSVKSVFLWMHCDGSHDQYKMPIKEISLIP